MDALVILSQMGTVVAIIGLAWQISSQRRDDRLENRQRWYERLIAVNQLTVSVDATTGSDGRPRGMAEVENTTPFVVRDLRLHIWPDRFGPRLPDGEDEAVVTRSLDYLEVGERTRWEFGEAPDSGVGGNAGTGTGEGVRWRIRFVDHTDSTWLREVGEIPQAIEGPASEIDPL